MAAPRGMQTPEPVSGVPGDDATVIVRSLDDPEQFAVVFRRHAPDIHRYVVRRLGPGPADDVVAETFLTAFRLRSRYSHDRMDARPWLYGIATNLIGRHRRAEVRQYRALARTGLDPVTESFADRADARVSAGKLRQALGDASVPTQAGQGEDQ
jgi:DNA-directed RNA polymerase specialized sigma24 family protein